MKYIILSIILFLFVNAFVAHAAAPAPEAPATPEAAAAAPAPEAPSTPEATPAPEAPATPEAAPATPTPEAAMGAAPAPAAPVPAGPEITPSQLTWPDTADLADNAPELMQSNDPKIVELFKKASQSFDAMAAIIDPLIKTRTDLYQKYFELDAKLDEFFQNTSLDEGSLQASSSLDNETTTPQQPPTTPFKQELDQINKQQEGVNTTKGSIKKILATLDSEIDKSKTLALQSRKKGLDILKQTTEKDAQGIYDGINKDLETLTTAQKNLQPTTTQDFQAAYDKIQADIQTIQNLVGQLRAKAIIPQEQPAAPTAPQPASQAADQSQQSLPTAKQQPTFFQSLSNKTTELFTNIMNITRTGYTRLKDLFTNAVCPRTPQMSQPLPITQPQSAQTQPTPVPAPMPQPAPIAQPETPQTPTIPESSMMPAQPVQAQEQPAPLPAPTPQPTPSAQPEPQEIPSIPEAMMPAQPAA